MKKIFQKVFSAALAVCVLASTMPITTAAAEAPDIGDKLTVNGIQYQITKAGSIQRPGTVKVTTNSEAEYSGILEIPEAVTDGDYNYYVKAIGASAFKGCTGLTGVLLPSDLGTLEASAFEGCTGLTSIDLSNVQTIGSAAFRGCTGLTRLSLYEQGANIGVSAFEGCTGLTKVLLSAGMVPGKSAFKGCTGLKDLTIMKGVKNIGESEFEGCTALTGVTIPDGMNSISDNAFKDCTALKSVLFYNETPGTIQSNIFSGCTSLEKIYVPNSNYQTVLTQNLDKLDSVVFTSPYKGSTIKYRVIGSNQVEVVANNYNQSEIEIPETAENESVTYSVTGVGNYAFCDFTALTKVTLPAGVTSIGEGAFMNCSNLTGITMPGSLRKIGDYAFYGCSELTVTLPDSLISIESYAFFDCDKLSAITIPSNVTEIENFAFGGCSGLIDVSFAQNSKLTVIGNRAFSYSELNEITIPSGITAIERSAFYDCEQLTSVTFEAGSNLKSIGAKAFSSTGLTKVSIPSGVSSIGKFTFDNCKSLESVSFKDDSDLEILGENALLQCTALEKVDFPENSKLISIGNNAFDNDTALTQITIPSGVKAIGEQAFMSAGLTGVSVPSGVKWIGSMAFAGCTSLPAIAVEPENADYCSADGVLYNKAKTELITYPAGKTDTEYSIPAGTTSIDMGAFFGNSKLTKAMVPSGVAAMGMGVFANCSALKTAVFECSAPPEFVPMIFMGDSLDHVYVPASALTAYQNCAGSLGVDKSIIEGVAGVGNKFTADGLQYEIISMSPNKVKVIANADPCTYSGSITIPETVTDADSKNYAVTEIGQNAFLDCSNLSSISMPDSITSIGDWAFENCSKLTGVTVPENVTQIGKYAFKGCTGLTEIKLPADLDSLGVCSFMNCTGLESVTVPDKLEEIGQQAFDGCTKLKDVSIGSGVTSVGDMAFMGCSGLKDITIPEKVGSIGQSAFMGAGLTGLTFKGNVDSVGDGAFYFASQLAKITFEGATPPKTVGKDLFTGDTYPIRAVVPAGTVTAYEAAFSAYTKCDPVQLKFEAIPLPALSAPSGLVWDGTTAKWDKVTGAAGYTVTLYKDGKAAASESVSSDTLTYDFKNQIKDSDGDYTFKVVAKGNASVSDSAESAASGKYKDEEEKGGSGVISSFDPLTSYKKTVAYGTTYEELGLPTALKAVVDNISNQIVNVIKWVSTVTFDGNTAGTYDFTPVLDSGYRVKDSGKLPHITVTMNAKQESHHSDSSNTEKKQEQAPKTEVRIDSSANTSTVTTVADSVSSTGDTSQISVTVPDISTDTSGTNAGLDAGKKAKIEINLPKDTIVQQLAAKKDVDLTLTVPASVTNAASANTAVDIKVNSDILAAAKANESDVTIKIKDTDTQQLAYSWTFKGEDLAKSTTPVTDVNISMAIRLTTEVSQVNKVTPNNVGLVLVFDHSGVLPSTASVTFSAKEKGFKPGQNLYFYYYNPATGQIDAQNQMYTVGPDGMVTVRISHCSNYVLLPHSARTITLDTRSYTMPVGNSYETGVKLTGVSGAKIRAYSSTKGAAVVTVLKNGNVKATAAKPGRTYIMIDVYDSKNKLLTHASILLTVQNGVKANGNSARQHGIF